MSETDYIKELENEFSIELKSLKYNLDLYSNVFTPNEIRKKQELEHQKNRKIEKTKDLIHDALFNQNKDSKDYELKAEEFINNILESFKNNKYQKLIECIEKNSTLIVPDRLFEIWSNFNKNKGTKILKWYDFKEKLKDDKIEKNKNIYFLSLFGYEKKLIYKLKNTSQNYFFIAYPDEAKIITKSEKNLYYFDLKEYKSEDRKKLIAIDLSNTIPDIEQVEENETLLDDYFEDNKKEKINYKIYFQDNSEPLILDGDKSVILESNSKKEKIEVYKLKRDDLVRIYVNLSKDKLFEIALSENKEGRFLRINENSKIWKKVLSKYYENKYSNIDLFLTKLQSTGCSLKNIQSLKKWLDPNDKEKFPKSLNDLNAIKELVKNQELNDNFETIKKSKTEYRGIMISLGRDLSEEINDYIINKIKGTRLEKFSEKEIEAIVNKSAPTKKILKIEKTEEEEDDTNG